jgi:poly(3-hydroxybutyrate) depolymerase
MKSGTAMAAWMIVVPLCSCGSSTPDAAGGAVAGSAGAGTGGGDRGAGGYETNMGAGGVIAAAGQAGIGTGGEAGTSFASVDAGPMSDSSTMTAPHPSGPSAGCGTPAGADNPRGFTLHNIDVPVCTGAVSSKCVTKDFAPGGVVAQSNGAYNFTHRNYALQLPVNYDPQKAYPLMIGGGGCGGGPTESGGGFTAGESDAIRVGLSYVKQCFADGGESCAGTAANESYCVNTPEVPYFYAMLADVEAKFCVDRARVFVGGYSSGAWESFTLGCAAGDVVRGIVTDEGGLRNRRPACTGPVAALMVVGEIDTDNPVGPLVMGMADRASGLTAQQVDTTIQHLDSNGSAPARDAYLQRNGCGTGSATMTYDPAYPQCVKYQGCPREYPVVWCPVPGAGHSSNTYQGVNYYPGSVKNNPLMWTFLSSLPVLQ